MDTHQEEPSIVRVLLDEEQLKHYWRYCDILNKDLGVASRFVEPVKLNYEVYSLEFAKIILSACSEIEAVGKLLYDAICKEDKVIKKDVGMNDIATKLLLASPLVYESYMTIPITVDNIFPFLNWKESKKSVPKWWADHNDIKHSRHIIENYKKANLNNAIDSVAALAVFNNYLYYFITDGYAPPFSEGGLFDSPYGYQTLCVGSGINLPNCILHNKKQ